MKSTLKKILAISFAIAAGFAFSLTVSAQISGGAGSGIGSANFWWTIVNSTFLVPSNSSHKVGSSTIDAVFDELTVSSCTGCGAGGGVASTDWNGSGTTLTSSSTYTLINIFATASSTQLRSPSSTLGTIKATGTILASSSLDVTGATILGSTLQVGGSASFLSTTSHSGIATFSGTINASSSVNGSGAWILGSTLQVGGTATLLGAVDIGSAVSLEIPNAAGGTTVNTSGEITVDTTSKTLNYYDGTAERPLGGDVNLGTFIIENPTATENFGTVHFDRAVTISKVSCLVRGSSPSVTFNLPHGTSRAASSSEVFAANQVCTNTATSSELTSFSDATLAADEMLWLITSVASSTELNVTLFGSYDP